MPVVVKAEQALIIALSLHALWIWLYQLDLLTIVFMHGF